MTDSKLLKSFYKLKGKIGLLGGSFDPIHYGHINAAKHLISKLGLSCCIFIPTHKNPLKHSAPYASDNDRLAMLLLALEKEEKLYVSDIELDLSNKNNTSPSYTVETLKKIRHELAPKAELYFLIGTDIVPHIGSWYHADELFSLAHITPYTRAKYELTNSNYPFDEPVVIPEFPASSTEIRALIQHKSNLTNLLPIEVFNYIKEHQLY